MRWLVVLLILSLAGCATKMGKDGRTRTTVDAKYLVKSDVDRIADAVSRGSRRRSAADCRQALQAQSEGVEEGGAVSREAPSTGCASAIRGAWPEFGGLRERQAAALAFSNAYEGDRVAALIYGLLTMVDAAFEHKEEFYILDSLDERSCTTARATWKSPSGS
jgi:hypothetical protein